MSETRKARLLIPVFSLMLAFLLFASPVHAEKQYNDSDPDDYITEEFNVDISVTEKHVVHYQEYIKVDFIQSHHGITRYIPKDNSQYSIRHIKVRGGEKDISYDTDTVSIRIGDADTLLKGEQEYEISYDLVFRPDRDESADELYIDLLPTGWETSIREADINLTMPKNVDPDSYSFTAGLYGSTDSVDELADKTISSDGRKVSLHVSDNPEWSGVTVLAELENGYWTVTYKPLYILWAIIAAAVLALSAVLFIRNGRMGEVVKTVEFYPPEGITPAETGYIIDGRVDREDIFSLILYFAGRGYLKIHEYKKNQYELIQIRPIDPEEKPFAITLFKGLFKGKKQRKDGTRHVYLDSLPANFYQNYQAAVSSLKDYYEANPVYTKKSRTSRGILTAMQVLMICFTDFMIYQISGELWRFLALLIFSLIFQLLGRKWIIDAWDRRVTLSKAGIVIRLVFGLLFFWWSVHYTAFFAYYGFGFFRSLIRSFFQPEIMVLFLSGIHPLQVLLYVVSFGVLVFTVFMPRLTDDGKVLFGKLTGFHDFIRDAEYERMKLLSDEDPEYFYKIMPYAEVLGMSTALSKKFSDIPLQEPEWYSTYDTTRSFNYSPVWYGSMMHSMSHSFSRNTTAPDSGGGGGGGGFSGGGGGFSGGGAGGGGGGAW